MYPNFAAFLAAHRATVESLEVEAAEAWWQSSITGTPEDEARSAAAEKKHNRVYADSATYDWLKSLETSVLTADEKRQYSLLTKAFLGRQMEQAVLDEMVDIEVRLEGIYNNYRATLYGEPATENALRDILRNSDDNEQRQSAWAATKQVGGKVAADVLHLVNLRNREAQRLGYSNFYEFSLALQELEVESLFALLNDLREKTDPLWKQFKAELDGSLAARFQVTVDTLRPWHYGDPFFQEAPPGELNLDQWFKGKNQEMITGDFFAVIGLPVEEILQRSDLYEKPGKGQHGFCIHIGRFEDVRVLCNCTDTERWMATMLHEFGHAVYDKYLGVDLPFFLRDTAHTMSTEAIAMLMGRLSRNGAWLQQYADVPSADAAAIEAAAKKEQRGALLVFIRWCLVMTHFERAMYENPDQDLNRLWWELVERFQDVRIGDDRNEPDWAAKLHIALAPVYYQNYQLGEMFASQLLHNFRTKVLPVDATDRELVNTAALGLYLTESVFNEGARLRWDELVEKATGEPLNPQYLLDDLTDKVE